MGEFRKAWATVRRAAGLATTEVRNGRTILRRARHVRDDLRNAKHGHDGDAAVTRPNSRNAHDRVAPRGDATRAAM
jgi:hypothetical protein